MKMEKFILISLVITLVISGCSLDTSGLGNMNRDKRSFIDAPLDESAWQAHRPIAITVHANFDVSRILVDIIKVPSDPSFHDTLETSIQTITPALYQSVLNWTPPAAGRYRLMAYSYTGSRINAWESWTTHTIFLNITEESGGGADPTPPSMPTSAPADDSQPPWVDFWADQYSLIAGSCTTLRWEALRVDQLFLDGAPVAFSGSREICPSFTTSYMMLGTSSNGDIEYPLTINVSAPQPPMEKPIPEPPQPAPLDNTGPAIGGMSPTVVKVFDNSACGPASTTITVNVQDPGGIGRVEMHYRARTESTTGTWRFKNMSSIGSGIYSVELGIPEFASSLAAFSPGRVDFHVKAWDSAGNMTQGVQMSIETAYCLF